jgi:glutathione S-transferase
MGAPIGDEFPALVDWRARVGSRPAVSAVLSPMAALLKTQGRRVPAWVPV